MTQSGTFIYVLVFP